MRKMKMKKIVTTAMAVAVTAAAVMGNPIQARAAEFDPVFYAAAYADVAAALGTDAEVLYNHYVNYGQKEGRVPYAGAAAGEVVDGIAGVNDTTATATVAQAPAADDIGDGPFRWWNNEARRMEEVDKATFLQKKQELQQKFDASGYVHVGWTEEQVYERLMRIKANLYPEGTVVGICQSGASDIRNALYGDDWEFAVGLDGDDNWIYVDGHVSSTAKGSHDVPLKSFLRVGDMLFNMGGGTGHVQIVLSRDDNGITVVESNWNDDKAMHWGRRIFWDDLDNANPRFESPNQWHEVWRMNY